LTWRGGGVTGGLPFWAAVPPKGRALEGVAGGTPPGNGGEALEYQEVYEEMMAQRMGSSLPRAKSEGFRLDLGGPPLFPPFERSGRPAPGCRTARHPIGDGKIGGRSAAVKGRPGGRRAWTALDGTSKAIGNPQGPLQGADAKNTSINRINQGKSPHPHRRAGPRQHVPGLWAGAA